MRTPPAFPPPWGPEPERSIPEAQIEALSRAYEEWRGFLPHGLSIAAYQQRWQYSWIRDVAISSATAPLLPVLPPHEIIAFAEAAADETFFYAAHRLSLYEPD